MNMQAPTVYTAASDCGIPGSHNHRAGLLSLAMTALRLTSPKTAAPQSKEVIITLDELSWHDHPKDCWIVLYDRVYDITEFLDEHPGGSDILLEYAGRDATLAFRGSGHSRAAISALSRYHIGELPQSECLFRKPGGIKVSGVPE